jgi:hypothetical protein
MWRLERSLQLVIVRFTLFTGSYIFIYLLNHLFIELSNHLFIELSIYIFNY